MKARHARFIREVIEHWWDVSELVNAGGGYASLGNVAWGRMKTTSRGWKRRVYETVEANGIDRGDVGGRA